MRISLDQKHAITEIAHNYDIIIDSREIFLYGSENQNNNCDEIDFLTSSKLVKNISILEQFSSDPIIIHQYTSGGDWNAGIMIYDIIKNCSCYVICIMHGLAASMGSIIPQAADVRIIMPNCSFMIHNGSTYISGTYKQAQSLVEVEKSARDVMLDIYSNVVINGEFFLEYGYDVKKIRKFLIDKLNQKEDWWLSAKEVVKYGFADGIFGEKGYETIEKIKGKLV